MGASDEEEGSHEAPCHEGSSTSGHEGHACYEEEGSHEAPCHEGSSTSGHEGHACDEEEGSHEAPCHEGSSTSAHEGHEGHEVSIILSFCLLRVMLMKSYRIDAIGCVES